MTICEAKVNKMQFSDRTLSLLKNFSSINSNILIKRGNILTTISPMKNLMGKAEVSEDFPVEFGVWDLNKFLGTISLFSSPKFEFEDNRVVISNGNDTSKVVYYYSDPNLLTTINKEVKVPDVVLKFELKEEILQELIKASSVLQLPDMIVSPSSNRESVDIILTDKKDKTSNTYTLKCGVDLMDVDDFNFVMRVENIKILSESYIVSMSSVRVSNFKTKDGMLNYWIALESDTTCTE